MYLQYFTVSACLYVSDLLMLWAIPNYSPDRYGAGTGVFVQVLSKCTNIVVTRNDAEGVN